MAGDFRERIDMAVFGPLPDFIRSSIRLRGLDASRGATQAAALLRRAGQSAAELTSRDPRLRSWYRAYAAIGLDETALPPPEILAAWAGLPGGVPSQGPLPDLVNAFALQHVLPAAVYDLHDLTGDLWLRPSRGCERFEGLGAAAPESPPLSELILVDSGDAVFARQWHGAQGAPMAVSPGTTDILLHLDFLPPTAAEASALTTAFVRLVTGFLGGVAQVQTLTWELPQVAWRSGE